MFWTLLLDKFWPTKPNQSIYYLQITPRHNTDIHFVLFMIPDQKINHSIILWIKISLCWVKSIYLQFTSPTTTIYYLWSEVDHVIVVLSQIIHQFKVTHQGSTWWNCKRIQTILRIEPEKKIGVLSMKPPLFDNIKQSILWKQKAILELYWVDGISKVIWLTWFCYLVVNTWIISNIFHVLCMCPWSDGSMVDNWIVSLASELNSYFKIFIWI